jgi:site-specific recombinase XerC
MKRGALPAISASGEVALNHYEQVLRTEEDLSAITIGNYLSDLRQFALWYEVCFQRGHDSLDTTMIYIRATKSDLQKEVEKIAWV